MGVIAVVVVVLAMTFWGNYDPFDDDNIRVKGCVAVAFGALIGMVSVISDLGKNEIVYLGLLEDPFRS